MNDELRLSDMERLNAMSTLASHYTEGRLDNTEFDERSLAVSEAKTIGDLRPLFADLPGQLDGALTDGKELVAQPEPEADLEDLRSRGVRVEKWDAAIGSSTLALFFILMFVFDVSWAWVVWPVMGAVLMIPRAIHGLSDSDEDTYEEIKKVEAEERKARLKRAAKRMKELEE
ncbi:DUF1707 domain-containing protein [Corynebacterium sp.]|uniref:DUF1707 SHOCT-like domain-containing protein n=1 Tax=Corynebacterium sp. TaxID=1720 RepID=UPI0026DED936|nr:DUF1707 domain-containing protein [Corynebacterium sp.]MDO5512909.1 DUF1707 domain-containing protein [Corynebacterium sp.]